MSIWFRDMRIKNAIITGPMLKEKACKFAHLMEIENFTPSNGWLDRWKGRNNINFKKIQGEKVEADTVNANLWIETTLPNLIKDYDADDV